MRRTKIGWKVGIYFIENDEYACMIREFDVRHNWIDPKHIVIILFLVYMSILSCFKIHYWHIYYMHQSFQEVLLVRAISISIQQSLTCFSTVFFLMPMHLRVVVVVVVGLNSSRRMKSAAVDAAFYQILWFWSPNVKERLSFFSVGTESMNGLLDTHYNINSNYQQYNTH